MRLATKNEMLTLMGDCSPRFAVFCLSLDGAVTKFLFDNATNYDLDLPTVQGMITQMYAAGVLDSACLGRFAEFGQPEQPKPVIGPFRYRVPGDYPLPVGATSEPDYALPGFIIITTDTAIEGRQVL